MSRKNKSGQLGQPNEQPQPSPAPVDSVPVQSEKTETPDKKETIDTESREPTEENEEGGQTPEVITSEQPKEELKAEEVENKPDTPNVIEEDNSKVMLVGTASSEILSTSASEVDVNVGLTKIRISYPKDFSGKKFFEDGEEKFVSREVAEQFEELGIATIIG